MTDLGELFARAESRVGAIPRENMSKQERLVDDLADALDAVKAERDELVAQITTVIHDLDRARNNGTAYTYGNIQERLRNALAALLRIRVKREARSD